MQKAREATAGPVAASSAPYESEIYAVGYSVACGRGPAQSHNGSGGGGGGARDSVQPERGFWAENWWEIRPGDSRRDGSRIRSTVRPDVLRGQSAESGRAPGWRTTPRTPAAVRPSWPCQAARFLGVWSIEGSVGGEVGSPRRGCAIAGADEYNGSERTMSWTGCSVRLPASAAAASAVAKLLSPLCKFTAAILLSKYAMRCNY